MEESEADLSPPTREGIYGIGPFFESGKKYLVHYWEGDDGAQGAGIVNGEKVHELLNDIRERYSEASTEVRPYNKSTDGRD